MNETILFNEKINIWFSGTWNISESHFELLKIYQDSIYINYETFTFLLVVILVWLLLMITLIKTFQYWFNFWFFLVTNEKLLWKK